MIDQHTQEIVVVAIGAMLTLLIWGALLYWMARESPSPDRRASTSGDSAGVGDDR